MYAALKGFSNLRTDSFLYKKYRKIRPKTPNRGQHSAIFLRRAHFAAKCAENTPLGKFAKNQFTQKAHDGIN